MMSRGGMSLAPLNWQEVHAYSAFADVEKYEAMMIIAMSRAFVDGLNMNEMSDKPPYEPEYFTKDDLIARDRSLDIMMGI